MHLEPPPTSCDWKWSLTTSLEAWFRTIWRCSSLVTVPTHFILATAVVSGERTWIRTHFTLKLERMFYGRMTIPSHSAIKTNTGTGKQFPFTYQLYFIKTINIFDCIL